MFHRIVLATDLGDASEAAARVASELAREQNASLTAVHVYVPPMTVYGPYPMLAMAQTPDDELRRAADAALREWIDRVESPAAFELVVLAGEAAEAVLAEAQVRRADLLVAGTHGRRGLSHVILGSTAERLVRLSPIPVLTVHGAQPE
jgi:nucleotide-binding universal stress UspA family protein